MTARDLEDFIKVIETAEKLSSRRSESTRSTAPTDLFAAKGEPVLKNVRTLGQVPKLWSPKNNSDFLGSSWGSSTGTAASSSSAQGSTTTPSSSSGQVASSSSTQTTARHLATSSSAASTTSPSKSRHSSSSNVFHVSSKSSSSRSSIKGVPTSLDRLTQMQGHSKFGRIQAKDLSPSVTPESSPMTKRRSAMTFSSATSRSSVSRKKTWESSSSPSKVTDSGTNSSTSSPSKPTASSKSSTSRVLTPIYQAKSSSESGSNESVIEIIEPTLDESPRSHVPRPRSKVSIKATSVKVHDHSPIAEQMSPKKMMNVIKRPQSAPGRKPVKLKPKPKTEEVSLVDLRNFSKSLKLLGLQIASNRREATKLCHQELNIRTKSPTLRTRLKERTQSVADLQEVIDSKELMKKEEFDEIKDALSRAVFEEWYFRKVNEELEQKRKEQEAKDNSEYEREQKEMNEEAFDKWMKQKEQQQRAKKNLEPTKELTEEEKEEKLKKIKAAEAEWLEKKRKEFLHIERVRNAKLKRVEEEMKAKEKKKEEAIKHFQSWKEKIDKEQKEALQRKKEAALEIKHKQLEEKEEKRKDAEAAFNAWVRKKKELEDQLKESKGNKVDENHNTEKLEAAQKAYEAWLDSIEVREIEDRFLEEDRMQRQMWRPPWYPGGAHEAL